MSDLQILAIGLACVVASWLYVALCDRLRS
jgi:hypothetical protein